MYDKKPDTSLVEDLEVLGLLSDGESRRLQEMGADPSMAPDEEEKPEGELGAAPGAGAPPAPKPAPKPAAPPAPPAPDAEEPKEEPKPDMYNDEYDEYDDDLAAYEAAWDVVKRYYALNESGEQLSEDDFKTVINAMAYIIEAHSKYMGPDLMDKDPQSLPGGNDPAWAGDSEHNPYDKLQGVNPPRRPRGWKYHTASPLPGEKAESLDALVGELKSLTQQTESDDEMQELGAKIVEGFEAIRDTADNAAGGIANELRESKTRVSEDHPRVKLGKYFEGVANDARLILRAIAERDTTDVDDAIEDLNSLTFDLKKGLARLSD